ncbi:MAG: polymerase, partial [Mastigocladus sp. ERB_26_1]
GKGYLAHNDYIRALVEGGIVGFVTFLVFLGVQGIRIIQLMQSAPRGSAKRDLCLIMLALFLSIPVAMITENIWSHTTLFFYWMTLMAVAGWDWNERSTVSVNPSGQISSSFPN